MRTIRLKRLQQNCFSDKFIDVDLISLLPPTEDNLTITVVHGSYDDVYTVGVREFFHALYQDVI